MSNKNNNLIFVLFGTLIILISGVIVLPKTTNAYFTNASYIVSESNVSTNPSPIIISINPNSTTTGLGAKTIIITGTGFIPTSIAKWNGGDRATTYVDSRHLKMELTSEDMRGLGKYQVNVWNPAPALGYSNTVFFTLNPKTTNTVSTAKKTTAITKKATSTKAVATTTGAVECVDNQNTVNEEDEDNTPLLSANVIGSGGGFMPESLLGWLILFIIILLGVILWRKLYVSDKEKNSPLKHA